jgi:hypothetical protein
MQSTLDDGWIPLQLRMKAAELQGYGVWSGKIVYTLPQSFDDDDLSVLTVDEAIASPAESDLSQVSVNLSLHVLPAWTSFFQRLCWRSEE